MVLPTKQQLIAATMKLPNWVYRMDERQPDLVRQTGLQPKGARADAAFTGAGVDETVTIMEHVTKTRNGQSINDVDPWVSCFAWRAFQPMSMDTNAFVQGYMGRNGACFIYKMDTKASAAAGRNFYWANAEFMKAGRESPYPGQMEWSFFGTIPSNIIESYIPIEAITGHAPDIRNSQEYDWTPL